MPDLSDDEAVRHVQTRLKALGFFTGYVGGTFGPLTQAAFDAALPLPVAAAEPPWLEAGREVLGLHEVRDNARLAAWLKKDGKALGDPKALPWCGDFVDTALRIALPAEERPGALGVNPYWALNWLLFGRRVEPGYGVVGVKERNGGGHVTFLVGEDATHYRCLGGNQGNTVSVARIAKGDFEGFRWPKTWPREPRALPRLSSSGAPTGGSEA